MLTLMAEAWYVGRLGTVSLAGRVLWPVLAALIRVAIVLAGGLVLLGMEDARPVHFFWLIAAGMAAQAIVSGMAIRMGAWRHGLDRDAVPSGARHD